MGLLNGLTVGDRFFNALGSSVSERTFCDGGGITGYIMTLGPTAAVDPESLVHSRYIIIWACNVLSNNLHLWPFIEEAQRRGAKVVCIDPVAHRTAKKADWHIPIRPGTDGALALAMMHVIIGEGLHDAAYVEQHTVGFEQLAEHVVQYTPEWAAAETGIDADDIRTLAREYAAAEPSMIRVGVALERSSGGGNAARAVSRPAGAGRRLAQGRRWGAADADLGVPRQVGRAARTAPRRRRRPHHQPVAVGRGARRRRPGPADQGAVRLQLQPRRRHLGAAGRAATGSPARTCSPWCPSTS